MAAIPYQKRFSSDDVGSVEDHALNREYWERQKLVKKKLERLEMMLEMKRLRELEL